MSDAEIQALDYLRPEDADAVERVCDFLDATVNGMADNGQLATATWIATSVGILREAVLPGLRAEQKGTTT
jgi:hypothetical protein